MKAYLLDYLQQAFREKFALPAFSIDNLSTVKSVVRGAELCRAPVILMVSESSFTFLGLEYIKSMVETVTSKATVPVFLHFDHGQVIKHAEMMVDAGADSVMIDWSLKPIDENITGTQKILDYAHHWGIAVEAEIGHVGGEEDGLKTNQVPISDMSVVSRFYKSCPVDLLAIAAGSVHGHYKTPPHLHFDLIKKVSEHLKVPLVLHGGSGIPVEQVKQAIKCGICKVNIGTELKEANVKAIRQYLIDHPDSFDMRTAETLGQKAMLDVVVAKIKMCGADGHVR